jgi:hypothetical protein
MTPPPWRWSQLKDLWAVRALALNVFPWRAGPLCCLRIERVQNVLAPGVKARLRHRIWLGRPGIASALSVLKSPFPAVSP